MTNSESLPKGVAHGCDRGGLGYKLQACASGGGGSAEEEIHKGNGGYIEKGCTRTSFYKRDGKALASHLGWIGYFRPKNYLKKM